VILSSIIFSSSQGETRSQKTLFIQLISEFLDVYSPPTRLNNFQGANNEQDLWVLDDVGPWSFPPVWEEECSSFTKLIKLLDGQTARIDWGDRGQHVFLKTQNVPMIIVGFGGFFPKTLKSLSSRLFVVRWDSLCPVGNLTAERIAATIFSLALNHHLFKRDQPDEKSYLYRSFKPLASLWGEEAKSKGPIRAFFPSLEDR